MRRAWHVRVTFAECRSCSVFVVSKLRWPRSIVKERCRPRSISESSVSECVRLCDAHIPAMAYGRLYLWYVTTFCVTYVRTHVRKYVPCENRPSIQSLALMRSAIIRTSHNENLSKWLSWYNFVSSCIQVFRNHGNTIYGTVSSVSLDCRAQNCSQR